ncbi:MAG: FGGY family carbohydrate kinase [Pseudomonadota bacterium]|nr:FGGY family carbohydrate kinase [Pseudomonadota bacterium]
MTAPPNTTADTLTLALDQGTHASRALLFDGRGECLAVAERPVALHRRGDRVEQDPREILATTRAAMAEVLGSPAARGRVVARAGLATQRSSVVAWDRRTGEPLSPVLSWQDRRAAGWLAGFTPEAGRVRAITGLPLSPHYGASKLRWLLDQTPAVARAQRAGRLAMGPLASYLLFHLVAGGPLVVDDGNAARTLLWDLRQRDWHPGLLDLFGIPRPVLPECRPIRHPFGTLAGTAIPLTAVNGDQNAALHGLGEPQPSVAQINMGTGAFALVPTGSRLVLDDELLGGIASSGPDAVTYSLEGTVNGAGAALAWEEEHWGIGPIAPQLDDWLARPGAPPIFVNTVGGLGSPWWRAGPDARLEGDGEPWQRGVAVAESIVFLLEANLDCLARAGVAPTRLRVSGGLARADGLCQRLADLSGLAVSRPAATEATARGIAWLAAGQPSDWPRPPEDSFTPSANPALGDRYRRFCALLAAG